MSDCSFKLTADVLTNTPVRVSTCLTSHCCHGNTHQTGEQTLSVSQIAGSTHTITHSHNKGPDPHLSIPNQNQEPRNNAQAHWNQDLDIREPLVLIRSVFIKQKVTETGSQRPVSHQQTSVHPVG